MSAPNQPKAVSLVAWQTIRGVAYTAALAAFGTFADVFLTWLNSPNFAKFLENAGTGDKSKMIIVAVVSGLFMWLRQQPTATPVAIVPMPTVEAARSVERAMKAGATVCPDTADRAPSAD